ncbi:MAG: pyridoxamine 5'-phosphate oxidase family protein [Motilibacteraceae bacterium]
MGKVLERIDDRLREFLLAQHVFFVGTAPADVDGHVNVSPKGHGDTFAVLDERTVAWLDLTGSGAESLAHIRENGRVVVMACAFDGPPQVVRLHGRGRVVVPGDADWEPLSALFRARRGGRAVVVVDVTRISSSCGYAVPFLEHAGDRDLLERWAERKDDATLAEYHREKNLVSIDGLPALPQPELATD